MEETHFSISSNTLCLLWSWNKKILCAVSDCVIWVLCINREQSEIITVWGAIWERGGIMQMRLEPRAGVAHSEAGCGNLTSQSVPGAHSYVTC